MKEFKKLLVFVLALAMVVVVGSWAFRQQIWDLLHRPQTISQEPIGNDKIKIYDLTANQLIGSPLEITGWARGGWFFEGSFPVKLITDAGHLIVASPAMAESDWMTPEPVPFSVTLNFSAPTATKGFIIFKNDNPSGLPELDEEIKVPIRFFSFRP
jgi:hypothetical protein